MKPFRRGVGSNWSIAILVGAGLVVGVLLAPSSVYGHVGGNVEHLWDHIRPKANALYAKRADLNRVGLIRTTTLARCPDTSANPGASFTKIDDIGTFTKENSKSVIQVTFHGRLLIDSVTNTGQGALFELRVDDVAAEDLGGRSLVRAGSETGASMAGTFRSLSAGEHTVSMWAQVPEGTGEGAMWNPGCWEADHVIVNELG